MLSGDRDGPGEQPVRAMTMKGTSSAREHRRTPMSLLSTTPVGLGTTALAAHVHWRETVRRARERLPAPRVRIFPEPALPGWAPHLAHRA